MKIVVAATTHPLPPSNGMQLHLCNLLRRLRDRHDVTLVSSPEPSHDTSDAALDAICSTYVPARPPSHLRYDSRLMREVRTLRTGRSKVVDRVLASGLPDTVLEVIRDVQPDVVHLETGACAVFADQIPAPKVLVPLDASDLNAAADVRYAGSKLSQWFAAREARRWRDFERSNYAKCDAIVVVGDQDAHMLRTSDPRLEPWVIPNGVDTDYFTPPDDRGARDTVLLHGAMDYAPNVDAAIFAATEIMPAVWKRRPNTKLVLAGRDPSSRVSQLANEHTVVTGSVPDMRPLLQAASVYLCPMRTGSGIKNKLLEAFACGCPTVATRLATNGVAARPEVEVLVADDVPGIASSVVRLLEQPAFADELGSAARVLAEAMSWDVTADAFDRVYRRIA